MKRSLFLLLQIFVVVAAFAGWAFAKPSSSVPVNDLRQLSALADEFISAEERMLVVTIRGVGERKAVLGLVGAHPEHGGASCGEIGGKCVFVLRHSSFGAGALSETEAWMGRAASVMEEYMLSGTWNINVQGWLQDGKLADSVWEVVESAARAAETESYEDAATRSLSYSSPLFQSSIISGEEQINLQVAAHRVTDSDRWRVTLGTPAILIEY
ncbi:YwmB family TATA-box binding protein [Paenibacillus alkalitolerans]|uniref:YwmB family TATA-box binding protein n=1 Tax=Paenibacillus alkalitolerans TaxID=2799335 RepID=UPI0018F63A24|nr:YwmB family TATA-box binding protein [Paenibacillus alkalitolerans]